MTLHYMTLHTTLYCIALHSQHIVFAPPGATFAAGGKTFGDFASVKAAFTGGALSEAALKAGLVEAINALVQPVRDHFANDTRAKELLEKVRLSFVAHT